MRQVLGSLIGVAVLSACTHVPLSSIPKLAQIDPETTDLSQVELAVRVPQDFRLHRDGASINVALIPEGGTPETLALQLEHSTAPLTPFLERQQGSKFKILRFELDPEEAKRATDYRTHVIALKEQLRAEGRGGSASFSVGSTGCLSPGANPFQDLRMKFFMRTKPDEEFYPPIKEIRISPEDMRKEGDTGISFCDEEDLPRLIDRS